MSLAVAGGGGGRVATSNDVLGNNEFMGELKVY
jgi:hypothetical protein